MLCRVHHDTTAASGQRFPPAPVLLQSSLTRKQLLIEEVFGKLTEAVYTIHSVKKKTHKT